MAILSCIERIKGHPGIKSGVSLYLLDLKLTPNYWAASQAAYSRV